jgi:hypothetical protein
VAVGVVGAGAAALTFEAVTDRDWTLNGWEWPPVLGAALVVMLGALWGFARTLPAVGIDERSPLRMLVKMSLERRGYRIGRLPPLASEPEYALELDFDYVLAHYLERRVDARPF